MFKSGIKRPVGILLAVVMLFSVIIFITTSGEDASATSNPRLNSLVTSSILNNFVTDVTMWDISQTPPVEVKPGDTTYIGQNYMFEIDFAENLNLQLVYNSNGR